MIVHIDMIVIVHVTVDNIDLYTKVDLLCQMIPGIVLQCCKQFLLQNQVSFTLK